MLADEVIGVARRPGERAVLITTPRDGRVRPNGPVRRSDRCSDSRLPDTRTHAMRYRPFASATGAPLTAFRGTAYRVIQKALTEAHEHVGAVPARTIRRGGTELVLTVATGDPPDTPESIPDSGLGLHERVELLGGRLTADPALDERFAVTTTPPRRWSENHAGHHRRARTAGTGPVPAVSASPPRRRTLRTSAAMPP